MSKYYILYNPLAGNGNCKSDIDALLHILDGDMEYIDMTNISSYVDFFAELDHSVPLVLCGGDGTLNRFINETEGIEIKNELYYYPAGSGNDFANDIGLKKGDRPVRLEPYIRDLPVVTVNGKQYRYLNGIGYGLDGYCCEEGDRRRQKTDKPINYTSIAIKGLLFAYEPKNAEVYIDGIRHDYTNVLIAPTMNGKFFGGGMMAAPDQDRLNRDSHVTAIVVHDVKKLQGLYFFTKFVKGTYARFKNIADIYECHDVRVVFDKPNALQIDGETILNVTEYAVTRGRAEEK